MFNTPTLFIFAFWLFIEANVWVFWSPDTAFLTGLLTLLAFGLGHGTGRLTRP